MTNITISPFNRVEGDLDVEVKYEKNKVVDVRFISRLFRGLEIILRNKDPWDALVITPRVCGICGGSHLYSSASALDMIYNAEVPKNAVKLRNVLAMAETCQNDIRHTYLMFLIDATNRLYEKYEFYPEILKRWTPLVGSSYKEAIRWSKKYTEIYAIFGGQWPHGSAIIPGGITADPYPNEINKALGILKSVTSNYLEKVVLGGNLDQFLNTVKSVKDLDQWSEDFPESDLGKIWRFGNELGWHKLGFGSGIMLSYGHFPKDEYVKEVDREKDLIFRAGIYIVNKRELLRFHQKNVIEFVNKSYYKYAKGDTIGLHPFEGETNPNMNSDKGKYTFTKCFRYNLNGELVAPEVGALAMLTVGQNPLILDIVNKLGPSVLARVIARIVRVSIYHRLIEDELEAFEFGKPTYKKPSEVKEGQGYGLVEAPRGALGHWISVKDGKIYNYQMVTPTEINMGPEDPTGNKSHVAKALIGTEVVDVSNPIEVYHIIRSHDACMVCNVH